MQYEVEIDGRIRQVVVNRGDEGFLVAVDGRTWPVNVARVDAHTLSLVIGDEVRVRRPGPISPGLSDEDSSGRCRPGLIRSGTSEDVTVTPGSYEVTVAPDVSSGQLVVGVAGPGSSLGRRITPVVVTLNGRRRRKEDGAQAGSGPQRIVAPMPGKIVRVLVKTGEAVHARQPLVVVEAMKMENELRTGRDGTVAEIHAHEGMSVEAGVLLVVIQ